MPLRKKYSGPAKIAFECLVERGNLDTGEDYPFPVDDCDGNWTIGRFCDEMEFECSLPGRVSLHRPDGKELSDQGAFIGDVIATHKSVRLRYDETVTQANGAVAHGAVARATRGGRAFAAGGYAVGGEILEDGTAVGGGGQGGIGRGDYGKGGAIFAGSANNPDGVAEVGEVRAGKFIKNKVPFAADRPREAQDERGANQIVA